MTALRGPRGLPRFLFYLCLQFAVFLAPGTWLVVPAAIIAILGAVDGLPWLRWVRRAWPALLVALSPALVSLPLGVPSDKFWLVWMPGLLRSVRFMLVLASAAWLSLRMSPVDLRDVLSGLLKPLGRRLGGGIARGTALTLAFLPWTATEVRRADEAARLRGSSPARRPVRHLAALAVPVSVRTLEKARRSAEALSLRDPGF